MLPWWKRLIYSFLSVLFGGSIVGIARAFHYSLLNPDAHLNAAALLVSTCFIVIASLSGWLVALPIVLLVRDYSGWRVWLWGAIGICIGPCVVFGFSLYGRYLVLATLVSAMSTSAYLFIALRAKASVVRNTGFSSVVDE